MSGPVILEPAAALMAFPAACAVIETVLTNALAVIPAAPIVMLPAVSISVAAPLDTFCEPVKLTPALLVLVIATLPAAVAVLLLL